MNNETTYAYAGDIVKTYDEDGALIVIGKATGPDLDLDGQICDPAWLKTAMPAWMKWGNLREQHSMIAAGVGLELSEHGDDWHLKSEVVDENTRRKIEKNVLKGYSIGIKGAQVVKDSSAPGGRIVGGEIIEVSYVDRPCNPTAVTSIAKGVGLTEPQEAATAERTYDYTEKADAPVAEWKPEDGYQPKDPAEYEHKDTCATCNGLGKMPETGETCPLCEGTGEAGEPQEPGLRPGVVVQDDKAVEADVEPEALSTKTTADLRSTIASIGGAKDAPATIAHIKDRAAALKRDDLVPEEWKSAEADVTKVEHNAADLNAVRASLIALIKAELDEMLAGEEEEIGDVHQLLCTLGIFLEWWEGEAAEGETDAPFAMTDDEDEMPVETGTIDMDYMALGVSADLIKAAKDGGDDERLALRSEIIKALGVDEIRTELEIAKASSNEQIEMLTEELARVKQMAAPGGPAITRTAGQAYKSAEAERLQSEAERFRSMAQQITDPDLANRYRMKAVEMDRSASQIINA